jgi:hypothetical protein
MKMIDMANFTDELKLGVKNAKRNGNESRVNTLTMNSR